MQIDRLSLHPDTESLYWAGIRAQRIDMYNFMCEEDRAIKAFEAVLLVCDDCLFVHNWETEPYILSFEGWRCRNCYELKVR